MAPAGALSLDRDICYNIASALLLTYAMQQANEQHENNDSTIGR